MRMTEMAKDFGRLSVRNPSPCQTLRRFRARSESGRIELAEGLAAVLSYSAPIGDHLRRSLTSSILHG